jgi:hypothetical protein
MWLKLELKDMQSKYMYWNLHLQKNLNLIYWQNDLRLSQYKNTYNNKIDWLSFKTHRYKQLLKQIYQKRTL